MKLWVLFMRLAVFLMFVLVYASWRLINTEFVGESQTTKPQLAAAEPGAQCPYDSELPLPAHLMPRVLLPSAPLNFLETLLDAGNFSLGLHGKHLFELFLPYLEHGKRIGVLEEFEAPRELIELPQVKVGSETSPQTLDEHLPLQAAFNALRQLASAASGLWRNAPADFVPSMGLTCMREDFYLFVQYLSRLERVPLGRVVLVVNGRSAIVASLFVDIVHRLIPGFVVGYALRRNEGLPYAWNAIVRATFVLPIPRELYHSQRVVRETTDFVWITNVDVFHPSGAIANASREARRRIKERLTLMQRFDQGQQRNDDPAGSPQPIRVIRFARGFATFLFCRDALPTIGFFDESMFPAYGEDVEFQARLRSVGDYPISISVVHQHLSSVMLKRNEKLKAMVKRFPRWEYLKARWNLSEKEDLFRSPHIFKHPFNDPRIAVSSWFVDPILRNCVRYGTSRCKFEAEDSAKLYH
jgi:hypothetical protein